MFKKTTSISICILYFSLSLFSISCAYHCAFRDEQPPSRQHTETGHSAGHASHDHHHNNNNNHQDDSGHSKILFCKFVHKVGSSAIIVSQMVIAGLGFSLNEAPYAIAAVHQRIDTIHLSRGPPSALS